MGLLLREVCGALQEFGEIRQIAIQVLKSLMIKHTFDDRYASKVGCEIPNSNTSQRQHRISEFIRTCRYLTCVCVCLEPASPDGDTISAFVRVAAGECTQT